MTMRNAIRNLVFGPKSSSERYVAHLRSQGMVIGENTVIYSPMHCVIDQTRPWMIEIGDNVSITEGVTILTHGYDWSVFKGKYGDVLGSAGRVKIGSNVFIGMNATILKGVTIGDNVVIGANSLINKDVPSDCVVAGNPQRVICGIDEYLEKRRTAQVAEAADLYDCWRRNSPEGKRGGGASEGGFPRVLLAFRRSRCTEDGLVGPLVRKGDASGGNIREELREVFPVQTVVRGLRGVPWCNRGILPPVTAGAGLERRLSVC